MASAGSRQSSKTSSEVVDARSESLFWISCVTKPGVLRGTTNPRTPSGVFAQTTATSAMSPLVIHILAPLSTHWPSSSRAVVRMPEGSLPASGSVSPKHPMAVPCAMGGSHVCFCCSLPYRKIANMTSDPCTETKLRRPLSTASSSMHANP